MKKGFLLKKAVAGIMALSILLLPANNVNISDNLYIASAENYSISDEISSYTDEVIMKVNEERAKKGIAPLKTSPLLNQLAQIRSDEITTLFSHTRPDGTDGYDIIYEYGLSYSHCGENIAAGQRNPEDVMNTWINSSGHYANIMNANYNYIGVGFVYAPNSEYGYYWTQIFYKTDDFFENEYIPEETVITTTASETTIETTAEPVITTTESETTVVNPTIIGDVTSDDIVDIRDVTFLNQYMVSLVTFNDQQIANADTDRNGEIDIKDLGQLKKYIIKIIDKL